MAHQPVPNPAEVATMWVEGRYFSDWESVWVQHRWADASPLFRFTCAERDPIPELWTRVQFRPGDTCRIYLAGMLAINGVIVTRQVAYDGNNHGVQLSGKGRTWWAARSSIIDKEGNFDGMNVEQVARKVWAPFPVGVTTVGALNGRPFDKLQCQPGEKTWDFVERIARTRGIVLGSDHIGNFLLIDKHTMPVVQDLIEGQNILKMQCVITVEEVYFQYLVRSQSQGSDDNYGPKASEQEASAPGSAPVKSWILTPAEQPVKTVDELRERAAFEALWSEGTILEATVTVQGWLRSDGSLWLPGANVHVRSPMAMLNQTMKIMVSTFTQDSQSGTLTTLTLVAPWKLKDGIDYDVGRAGVPQAPGAATAGTAPAAAPPAAEATEPPPLTLPTNR